MTLNKPLVVLDTSTFISAYLSSNLESSPNKILRLWKKEKFTLIITPQLLKELVIILERKKIERKSIIGLVKTIKRKAVIKEGIYQTNYLDNIDPNDNMFLSACYEANADYLVSNDKHLLNLKHFHNTLIFNPKSFLNQLQQD
jgi:putative PIN family toxin of toxin-antitoxin system